MRKYSIMIQEEDESESFKTQLPGAIANTNLSLARTLISNFEDSELKDRAYEGMVRNLAGHNHDLARYYAELIQDEEARNCAYFDLCEGLALHNLSLAMNYVHHISDDQDTAYGLMAVRIGNSDPQLREKLFSMIQDSSDREIFILNWARKLAVEDPIAGQELFNSLPDSVYKSLSDQHFYRATRDFNLLTRLKRGGRHQLASELPSNPREHLDCYTSLIGSLIKISQ